MKQKIVMAVMTGLLTFLAFSATVAQTPRGKELYSSRPRNYQPPTLFVPEEPVQVPVTNPTRVTRPVPTSPGVAQTRTTPAPVLAPLERESAPVEPVVKVPVESQLMPPVSVLVGEEFEVPRTKASSTEQKEENTEFPIVAGLTSAEDGFDARLAKILLEKHDLEGVLRRVEKMNRNSRVKTLVDLAEYVSRDKNYKKEADILFELAVNAVDALREGDPIVVTMPTKIDSVPAPSYVVPKPRIVIQEGEEEILEPSPTVPQTELPKLALPEDEDRPVMETTPEPPARPEPPVSKRPSIMMIEDSEPEEESAPETKPAPKAPTKRPMPGKRVLTLEEN